MMACLCPFFRVCSVVCANLQPVCLFVAVFPPLTGFACLLRGADL